VTTLTGATPTYLATVWSSDRVGDISVVPPNDSTMARLGAITVDKTNHQLSEIWLSQPVYVQPGGLTQVTFCSVS
jgi:hypothetical protein